MGLCRRIDRVPRCLGGNSASISGACCRGLGGRRGGNVGQYGGDPGCGSSRPSNVGDGDCGESRYRPSRCVAARGVILLTAIIAAVHGDISPLVGNCPLIVCPDFDRLGRRLSGQDNRENDLCAPFVHARFHAAQGQKPTFRSAAVLSPTYPLTSHAGAHLQLRRRVGSRKAPGLSPTTLSVGLAQKTRELFRATCVQSISTRQTAKMSVT